MRRKADIARIAKGLSGREAGRLAVQELLEIDRGGPGLLSEKEIRALQTALRSPEDGADYRRMIGVYEALPLMLSEARIVSLQAEQVLGDLQRELERYWTSARVAETARLYSIAVHGSDEPDPPASGETREGNAGYWLTALSDVMEVRWLEEARAQRGGRSLTELLVLMHETAVRKACTLLAYQEVITQACALIGIEPPCCWPRVPRELDILFERSDGDDLSAGVREAAGTYNEVVKALDDWRDGFACPQLPPIEIDRLAPDPLTREVLHLRLGHGLGHANLGDDWWVKSY